MVERSSKNGCWRRLALILYQNNKLSNFRDCFVLSTIDCEEEDDLICDRTFIFDQFLVNFNLVFMKSKILQMFYQMRENDTSGNSWESIKLPVVPEEVPHSSCNLKNYNEFTTRNSGENKIAQCEIKHKLVDADNAIKKFFDENQCSVCLGSYKEILDDNFHLVVPSCGHPLCCACADRILVSTKKECPRCRGSVTAESFNLMKFNTDLELDQDQTVYL